MLRQKILFFPIVEGGAKMFRVFVWKITILRQKIIFFSILGGSALPPPPGSAPVISHAFSHMNTPSNMVRHELPQRARYLDYMFI